MDYSKNVIAIFDKYAADYQQKYMDVSLYHDTFDFFCENITISNPKILELACGPGNITKYLLEKRSDLDILGTDLAPKMLDLARQNNPNATFEILDCRVISYLKLHFDGIMCGFCLPYLSKKEAENLISDAAKLLNKNGLIYISTMEDDHSKSGIQKSSKGDELFMNFHEEKYLSEALIINGFEILKTKRKITFDASNNKVVDLILIAKLK